MTTADQTAAERLAQERRDADRRYNDALTALDRAVVDAAARQSIERDDIGRLGTALMVFLQQITGFVDTKDRALGAAADARIDDVNGTLQQLAEVRTQLNVVQRALQTLSRPPIAAAAPASAALPDAAPASGAGLDAAQRASQYLAFEDEFRSSNAVADSIRRYVPLFAAARGLVVDLGCGRGELLAALRDTGVAARGVDLNPEMAAEAGARGLDAEPGDALSFLRRQADHSLGGVIATQVVEHLEPPYLMELIATAAAKLRGGAPIVLETINPACWLAFFSSYIRDLTHARPIHPDTLQYLLRANGFERVAIDFSAPVPEHMKMKTVDVPPAMRDAADPVSTTLAAIAHTVNANAVILNTLMFSHMDYAAIGYRLS